MSRDHLSPIKSKQKLTGQLDRFVISFMYILF